MVLQEFSFQTVADGAFPKLDKHKKKRWPKFPWALGSLVVHNSTHAPIMGKENSIMNLGEAPKRMHDPKAYLASLFSQERAKFHYTLEDLPDDSIDRGAIDFREELENITDPEVRAHVDKYQKYIKQTTLHFRKLKFDAEDKTHMENMEKEARQQETTNSSSVSASQPKDKGKSVMETDVIAHSSQLDEVRHKGEEFMRNIEKLISQLQTQVEKE